MAYTLSSELTKEQCNYFRLCHLLVEGGTQVLRETYYRLVQPEILRSHFGNQTIRKTLRSFREGETSVPNSPRCDKLHPRFSSTESSANVDNISDLTTLLIKTCHLRAPSAGWDKLPSASDESTEADLARVVCLRNLLYGHCSRASLNEETFNSYWVHISCVLLRLGGKKCGNIIEKLKHERMNGDTGRYYQERLRQWVEGEGNAEKKLNKSTGVPDCLNGPKEGPFHLLIRFLGVVKKSVKGLQKRISPDEESAVVAQTTTVAMNSHLPHKGVNRLASEMYQTETNDKLVNRVVSLLDNAISLYQSDRIERALESLREISAKVEKLDETDFPIPTKFSWQVVHRGRQIFFDESVSCSVRHGTIILDSSNGGAQLFVSLLNILAAFALETSEFQMAQKMFSRLIEIHRKSVVTSRFRDLGSAFNNRGCVSAIISDLDQADHDFKNAVYVFKCEEQINKPSSLVDVLMIALRSNISHLNMMSRKYAESLEEQDELVVHCKRKAPEFPLQTVFTVLHNQAVLHTTLENFSKAEEELQWLMGFCEGARREECDFLLNFVSLCRCEVLLLHGKPKEAHKVFPLEALITANVYDLIPDFGGLHVNVRMQAFEKLVDVFVIQGKVNFAFKLLEKGLDVVRKAFGENHFNVALLLLKQGSISKLRGDVSGSFHELKQSAEILRKIFGERHPLLIKCYMSLGDLASQLQLAQESYLYFQRALENVEVLFQVSFSNELFIKYIEITGNSKNIPRVVHSESTRHVVQEYTVDGLVAEYSQAIAVLSSQLHVEKQLPGSKPKELSSVRVKSDKGPSLECRLLITKKHVRDLLRAGQTLILNRMNEEAISFFRLASGYCKTQSIAQGIPFAPLVRLYTVFSQLTLGDGNIRKVNNALKRSLNQVSKDISIHAVGERCSGHADFLTFDHAFSLKIALTLLILISVRNQAHDTTFAAYNLYASLSENSDNTLLFVKDGLQVYASRTSSICNGRIVMQDFVASSGSGLIKGNSDKHLAGKPLFRSLAYKSNVESCSFLATFNGSVFLDIDEVKQLEQRAFNSFKECSQIEWIENNGRAIQMVVDFTPSSLNDENNFLTGSPIELLPLYVSNKANTEDEEARGDDRNICVISPVLCQKITCVAFADEQTCCFMFSKFGLWVLWQCESGTNSMLSVEDHCLVLTVHGQVGARITLWHDHESIKQKIQFVSSEEGSDCPKPPNGAKSVEHQRSCREMFDKFSIEAVLHWAKTRGIVYEVSSEVLQCSYSLQTPYTEESTNLLSDGQARNQSVQVLCVENEKREILREWFQVSTLECLTAISEISCQLLGEVVEEEAFSEQERRAQTDHFAKARHQATCLDSFGCDTILGHPDEANIPHNFRSSAANHEADTEEQDSSLTTVSSAIIGYNCSSTDGFSRGKTDEDTNKLERRLFEDKATSSTTLNLANTDTNRSSTSVGGFLRVKRDEDANVLGRMLFEEGRKTRCFSIAKTQEDMKKESFRKMNVLENNKGSANGCKNEDEGSIRSHAQHVALGGTSVKNNSQLFDSEQGQLFHESGLGNLEADQLTTTRRGQDDEANNESTNPDFAPAGGEVTRGDDLLTTSEPRFSNCLAKQTTEENKNEMLHTSEVKFLPLYEIEYSTIKETTLPFQNISESGIPYRDQMQHQNRESFQGEQGKETFVTNGFITGDTEVEMAETEGSYTSEGRSGKKESVSSWREDIPRSGISENFLCQTETSPPASGEEGNSSTVGAWDQHSETDGEKRNRYYGPVQINSKLNEGDLQLNPDIESNSEFSEGATCPSTFFSVRKDARIYTLPEPNEDVVDSPASMTHRIHRKRKPIGLLGGDPQESCSGEDSCELIGGKDLTLIDNRVVVDDCVDTFIRDLSPNFGGARPKTMNNPKRLHRRSLDPVKTHLSERWIGLDDDFVARHAVSNNSAINSFGYLNFKRMGNPCQEDTDDRSLVYFERNKSKLVNRFPHIDALQAEPTSQGIYQPVTSEKELAPKQDESWHFPPLVVSAAKCTPPCFFHKDQKYGTNQCSHQDQDQMFESHEPQSAYHTMVLLTTDFNRKIEICVDRAVCPHDDNQMNSVAVSEDAQYSSGHSLPPLLGRLQDAMKRNLKLWASSDRVRKRLEIEAKPIGKVGVQEESHAERGRERTEITADISVEANETETEVQHSPVQETARPVCEHYQRRCLVSFPCCGKFYPCHRCHNESKHCSKNQAKAINATHIRCSICYHEQEIDERSQTCRGCNSTMSAYFCAICKHFTSVDKNPFHCKKCGICRIHSDKSFHCDVCNVCLDKRLQGKHKCRPNSGHDECCICLEDAFSGCQILPCSHKVHKDCAIAMIQNGVRTCPVCRHPLFQPANNTTE